MTSFGVLAEWGGGGWHHRGAEEWWGDWSAKTKNTRVMSVSRYGSDQRRHAGSDAPSV